MLQAGAFEVVEQVGHHGAVDAQVGGERELASPRSLGAGREHLIAARATGQAFEGRGGRLRVLPEDDAQRPAEVGLHRRAAGRVRPGRLDPARTPGGDLGRSTGHVPIVRGVRHPEYDLT